MSEQLALQIVAARIRNGSAGGVSKLKVRFAIRAFTLVALCSCSPTVSERATLTGEPPMLVESTSAFIFGRDRENYSVSEGQAFQMSNLGNGKRVVFITSLGASAVAGGMGAPVAMISTAIQMGVEVDQNSCTTGRLVVKEFGFVNIMSGEYNNNRHIFSVDPGRCFSVP